MKWGFFTALVLVAGAVASVAIYRSTSPDDAPNDRRKAETYAEEIAVTRGMAIVRMHPVTENVWCAKFSGLDWCIDIPSRQLYAWRQGPSRG